MQSSGYFNNIYLFGVIICGPKNRVCEIKSGHDFCRYRSSIQVIYFQINACTKNNACARARDVIGSEKREFCLNFDRYNISSCVNSFY